jgi:hypothetical protein
MGLDFPTSNVESATKMIAEWREIAEFLREVGECGIIDGAGEGRMAVYVNGSGRSESYTVGISLPFYAGGSPWRINNYPGCCLGMLIILTAVWLLGTG